MEIINWLFDFVFHMDTHLTQMVSDYHYWVYLLLFMIVLFESGCVLTPFLPGDSLLFATGAVMALPDVTLSVWVCMAILIFAAIVGFYINFEIGGYIGHRILEKNYKYFNRTHLEKTHEFYEKYGAFAILISRFLPFIRTYVPFVAGIALMDRKKFMFYNVLGGIIWIGSVVMAGYFLGNIPIVKNNFSLVILGIIIASAIPLFVKITQTYLERKKKSV